MFCLYGGVHKAIARTEKSYQNFNLEGAEWLTFSRLAALPQCLVTSSFYDNLSN